jgi:myosin heavy subunit
VPETPAQHAARSGNEKARAKNNLKRPKYVLLLNFLNQNTMSNITKNSGNSQQNTLLTVAAIIIVALLALNVYLWVNKSKQTQENTELSEKVDETEKLRAELEKQYYQALTELDNLRGSNTELNDLIAQKEKELTAQKRQIESLLRNKGELSKARLQIQNLNTQVQQYLAEINQLRQQNELLNSQNSELSNQNEQLTSNLESERQSNQQLSASQTQLLSEKQELEKTRENLSRKVNAASVIKVGSFSVTATDEKAKKTRKAKNALGLDICFSTTANEITDPGQELFLIRVIKPNGETLTSGEMDSGAFVNNLNGDQLRYSHSKETNYQNKAAQVCSNLKAGANFEKGTYKVEVYNKGFLAGTSSFSLN